MARAASRPAFWRLGAITARIQAPANMAVRLENRRGVPPALSWSASVKIAASGASVCRRASVSGERNLVDRTARQHSHHVVAALDGSGDSGRFSAVGRGHRPSDGCGSLSNLQHKIAKRTHFGRSSDQKRGRAGRPRPSTLVKAARPYWSHFKPPAPPAPRCCSALLGPGGPFVVGGVHVAGRGYHYQGPPPFAEVAL
jgi:hypothetical protein